MAWRPHRRLILATLLLVALGAVAFAVTRGEKEGCKGSGYPESPECVARAYVTRNDASKCDLVAPALLERLVGVRGRAARARCAAVVRSAPPPRSVEILAEKGGAGEAEREREGGDTAVVEVRVDGREGKLTLERSGGRWRITSFEE